MRLEYPCKRSRNTEEKISKEQNQYIDILVVDDAKGKIYPIELKYKTRSINDKKGEMKIKGEQYHLKNQSAHDCGCYDYLWDIHRIEMFSKDNDYCFGDKSYTFGKGYAIFLTNDPLYWKGPAKEGGRYFNFRLADQYKNNNIQTRTIDRNCKLVWKDKGEDMSEEVMSDNPKGIAPRNRCIPIQGKKYELKWKNAVTSANENIPEFKYIILEIEDIKSLMY